MDSHQQQQQHVKNSSQIEALQQSSSSSSSSSTFSSSPTHDFSFTISLPSKLISTTKTTSFDQQTVDLSPADDIFFHGHLLPLHLLSPRTSTVVEKDVLPDVQATTTITTITKEVITTREEEEFKNKNPVNTKPVNKSFSLFGSSKWRKGRESEHQQQQQQQKKKLMSLDLSHTVKKYIRMLFQRRGNGTHFMNRRQTNSSSSYSFSSSLMSSSSKGNNNNNKSMINGSRGGRRTPGELFSAPASMRTSPTNSGHLRVSTAGLITSSSSSSSSDSTMEELQAAIQAAIAHCKNSSAVVDR